MASISKSFVLVTGVSGFLGAHVVDQLVNEGHRVRGTVRSAKVKQTQDTFDTTYGAGKVEVVPLDDLIVADFTSALKGITAVIHVAAPLIGRVSAEESLNGSIEGSIRVLRQGQEVGIKNFSIISSVVALVGLGDADPNVVLTEKHWNNVTREEALDPSAHPIFVYSASKALAEKEIWKFAEAHPDINVTTLNPTFFLGPNAPGQKLIPGEPNALSTNLVLYNVILPGSKQQTPPFGFVDVRDVAAGLIAGIKVTGRNRVPLTGEWFEMKDAAEYIGEVRPELKDRLANIVPTGQSKAAVDNSKALEVLGIEPRSWKDTVIQTIDYLVGVEKAWKEQGIDIESRLKKNEWTS